MKRALNNALHRIASWVGPEGVLLIIGTACLAAFANTVLPAGAFAVVGGVTLLLGLAIAWKS